MKFFIAFLFCFFCVANVSAVMAGDYDFLQRRHRLYKKYVNPRLNPRAKEVGPKTEDMAPACVIRWIEAVEPGEKFVLRTADKESIPLLGVTILPGKEQETMEFLKANVVDTHVKICQPQLLAMPEKPYGLIYMEPILESVQELLIQKNLAKLKK